MDFNSEKAKLSPDNFTIHNNKLVPSGLSNAEKLLLPFHRDAFRVGLSQEICAAMDRIYQGEAAQTVISDTLKRCDNGGIRLPTEYQKVEMSVDEISTFKALFSSIVNAFVSFCQHGGNMDEMFFSENIPFNITLENEEVILGCQQANQRRLMVLERKLRDPLIIPNQPQQIPPFRLQPTQFLPTPFQQAMTQQLNHPSQPIQLDQLRNRAHSQPTPFQSQHPQQQPQMSVEEQYARRFETRRNMIVNNLQLQTCLREEINGIFNEIHNGKSDWRKLKSNIDSMLKTYNDNKIEDAHRRDDLVKALFQIFPTAKGLDEEGIKAFFGMFSQIFDGLCQFYDPQHSHQKPIKVMGDDRSETHFFIEKKDSSLILTNQSQVLMVLEDVVRGPLPVQEVVQQFVPQQQYHTLASQYPQTGYPQQQQMINQSSLNVSGQFSRERSQSSPQAQVFGNPQSQYQQPLSQQPIHQPQRNLGQSGSVQQNPSPQGQPSTNGYPPNYQPQNLPSGYPPNYPTGY